MKRIYLGGAGGAPTNGVINSLRKSGSEYLIGTSSVPSDLFLAKTDEKYWVPSANSPEYENAVAGLIRKTRPDLMHFQNDYEVKAISRLRDKILEQGVKLYMPTPEVIENCIDKGKSFALWQKAGVKVPDTYLINDEADLKAAFDKLGKVWLRAVEGAAGRGALPTDDYEFARIWVNKFKGWGNFTAAECLTSNTVTWLSIWYEGELVVAQTRRRKSWNFGDRTLSGVTGITGVGETWSDEGLDKIALATIAAVDSRPHGIYGVDMTYDEAGVPNPTEINISRFFTTVQFFTEAGLNMPRIFADIALYDKFPTLEKKINPLPDGLLWIRGMDSPPVLTDNATVEKFLQDQKAF